MDQTIDMAVVSDAMNPLEKGIKRLADFLCSLAGLIILSPVFLAVYVLLKKQDGGSVIFRQERIGLGGRPFTIYKFRTMKERAEKDGVPQLAEKGDDRLTPVGKWLREHHLDELPQLWNVLAGDMSMVGYRPERKYFIDKIMEVDCNYEQLYAIRPGLTSEATLFNGYTDTMDKMIDRLHMDIHYLENRSLALDCKIIVETFLSIVCGKKF